MTFYWYDYETLGPNPRRDRPAQFAGVRTNEDLEVVEDPLVLYCRPSPDYLPDPASCLIHGLSPIDLLKNGMRGSDFAMRIHQALTERDTCAVGYNAVRFDHEVTRFLFYRNLLDPYAWHWRDGCTRWDVIDLMRAAYALRPDGVTWPTREDGLPSFRLEDIARANSIAHESAHDAASDVEATVQVAALVKRAQPALFDYYLGLREKQNVAPFLRGPCVFVSGLVGADNGCATLVAPVCRHPDKGRGTIVYDLRYDPSEFDGLDVEELQELMFTRRDELPEGARRPRLYEIKENACPFVADPKVVDQDAQDRIGLDLGACRRHLVKLQEMLPSFASRVSRAYVRTWPERDVDEALYERLTPDDDRLVLDRLWAEGTWNGAASGHRFSDGRLPELIFRFRARNYGDALERSEGDRWKTHCRDRHLSADENGRTRLDRFDAAIARLREEHAGSPRAIEMLDHLAHYGKEVQHWLG